MRRTQLTLAMVGAVAILGAAALTQAQQGPGGGRGPGGQGGGPPGGFDPAAIQQRMIDGMLDQLQVQAADERELIGERLERVVTLRRQQTQGQMTGALGMGMRGGALGAGRGPGGPQGARGGGGRGPNAAGGGRGRGGPGGPGGQGRPGGFNPFGGEPSEVDEARGNLQQVLAADSPGEEQIREALTALREARARQQEQLADAQESLRSLLELHQEAVLVTLGILE